MNIYQSAENLLTYFPPEEREVPDHENYPGRNAAVRKAMNEAFQDLFGKGKPWVREDDRGFVVNPPATVTIAVTNGSKAGTITGWQSWMTGCTIVIAGAGVDNQIRNAAAAVTLKFPYSGPTGSHSATVYHDSIDVGTDVLEITGEVKLDRVPLAPMSKDTPRLLGRSNEDFGYHRHGYSTPAAPDVAATAGRPLGYSMETWSPDGTTAPVSRMRIYPAPASGGFLEFPVMLVPPRVDDISTDDTLPIPFQFIESIFQPIAVKKLRSCPFWRGIVAEADINEAYQNALALLDTGNPDKSNPVRLHPLY